MFAGCNLLLCGLYHGQFLNGNRRSGTRARCRIRARVYVDGRPAIPCEIANLSADGAQIFLPTNFILPKKILVYVLSLREVRAAMIRWRNDSEAGVEFIRGEADLPIARPAVSPDVVAMQAQVVQLTDVVDGIARRAKE
jgi:PilZ domain